MAAPPRSFAIPRWLARFSWPLSGFVLTTFFVFLGFPYELLAERLESQVEGATRMRVRIGELAPHLGFAGPGLAAREVLAAPEGGQTLVLQELVVRPAWSLAWLKGTPALHLDVESEIGQGDGVLTLGEFGGWQGDLREVRVETLPVDMLRSMSVEGLLYAAVDVHGAGAEAGGHWLGSIDFDLRDGSFAPPQAPIAVPFERLHGVLVFGDESFLEVRDVSLEGPMISGTIGGQIGHGPSPERRPLSLTIQFEVEDPAVGGMLGSAAGRGPNTLEVGGTVTNPVVKDR